MIIETGYPKRIDIQLIEQADEHHDYSIKDSNNVVILSSDNWCAYMDALYGNYKTCKAIFLLWSIYQATHYNDFLKAWAAWNAVYNPTDNYNGTETTVIQKMDGEQTETINHGKTTTNATGPNGVVNETQTTSVDNGTYRNDTKNIQTGTTTETDSGTTTTTKDTDVKTLTVGDKTYTADYVESEEKNRHGNLGITSTQTMIKEEKDMRLSPLICEYLDNFIEQYAYLREDEI